MLMDRCWHRRTASVGYIYVHEVQYIMSHPLSSARSQNTALKRLANIIKMHLPFDFSSVIVLSYLFLSSANATGVTCSLIMHTPIGELN